MVTLQFVEAFVSPKGTAASQLESALPAAVPVTGGAGTLPAAAFATANTDGRPQATQRRRSTRQLRANAELQRYYDRLDNCYYCSCCDLCFERVSKSACAVATRRRWAALKERVAAASHRAVVRVQAWWEHAHWPACCLYFAKAWFFAVLAFVGPIADVITILVYFKNGDTTWGTLSAVFVGLNWLAQFCVSFHRVQKWLGWARIEHKSKTLKAMSSRLDQSCAASLHASPLLAVFHMAPVFDALDAWFLGVEALVDGGAQAVRITVPAAANSAYMNLVAAVFASGPNLTLVVYILMNNRLGARFVYYRYLGWSFVWQILLVVKDMTLISRALNAFVSANVKSAVDTCLVLVFGLLDVATHVLMYAMCAASFRVYVFAWIGALFGVKFVMLSVSVFRKPGRRRLVATVKTSLAVLMSYFSSLATIQLQKQYMQEAGDDDHSW